METTSLTLSVRAALGVLEASIPGTASDDHQTALASTGTALFWACALDEQLARFEEYKSIRNQHPTGGRLPGLRLARNALAHGVATIVMPSQGLVWPLVWPLRWSQPIWVEFEVIRAGLERNPGSFQRMVWEQQIAGRVVADTLRDTAEWLTEAAFRFR